MTQDERDLLHGYLNGTIGEADFARLQLLLRENAEARRMLRDLSTVDAKLQELAATNPATLRLLAVPAANPARPAHRQAWFGWLQWRPLTAAAAGLVFGLFCASVAWAYAAPRVIAEARRLSALVDGSFEKQPGKVAAGFPLEAGVWSGDEAEVVSTGTTAKDGKQLLRFLKPDRDPNSPNSPANACDVYQIVDLRLLRDMPEAAGESTLELSAEFLDARTAANAPVIFRCHIYLFHGSADSLHTRWPDVASEALGTGSAYVLGSGGPEGGKWHKITARCVLPPNADFCVLRLSAGRDALNGGAVPELGMQFADDVKLILKTQPELPVRVVQH
jgi:hypothetical protein